MTKQPGQTKDTIAHFRLPRHVRAELVRIAAKRGMTLSELLRQSALNIYRRNRSAA